MSAAEAQSDWQPAPQGREPPLRTGSRLPHLDGLRGIAILLVLAQHWVGFNWTLLSGRTGVTLFFILSGYLITRILLGLRARAEWHGEARLAGLKTFYVRRALRIFPPFYIVLAAVCLIGVADARDYVFWHAAYLSNVLFVRLDEWLPNTAHLWSLAVEEQFYLAWPLLMLWLPRRLLLTAIVAVIVAAPLLRAAILVAGASPIAIWVLPPCVMDALGLGALLASVQALAPDRWARVRVIALVAAVAAFLAYWALYAYLSLTQWNDAVWIVAMDSLIALMLWPLVAWSIEPTPSWPLRWLTQRWLTYLGQISYMVYLLHLFMPEVTWLLASRAGLADATLSRAVLVPVWAALTIAVAMLSWHFVEQPILSRRRSGGQRQFGPLAAVSSALGTPNRRRSRRS